MKQAYPSTKLALPAVSGHGNDRPSVGLVVLTTDMTTERDFAILAAKHRLGFNQYVNRIPFCNPMTAANLNAMLDDLSTATNHIVPSFNLDAVVFCCTSGSAIIGDQAIEAAVNRAKPGAAVTNTAAASSATLLGQGYRRISLLTPYSEHVSKQLADYFEGKGLEITSLHYMDILDDRDVARLPAEYIEDAARAAADPSADCLFISCTAMRVVEIREQLEAVINQPVISSNYAAFWQTMRLIDGASAVHEEFGGDTTLIRRLV